MTQTFSKKQNFIIFIFDSFWWPVWVQTQNGFFFAWRSWAQTKVACICSHAGQQKHARVFWAWSPTQFWSDTRSVLQKPIATASSFSEGLKSESEILEKYDFYFVLFLFVLNGLRGCKRKTINYPYACRQHFVCVCVCTVNLWPSPLTCDPRDPDR